MILLRKINNSRILGDIMIDLNIDLNVIAVVMFFIILISVQFTLNKILFLLKEIKAIMLTKKDK
jgi:hypothetical protein